MKVLNFHCELVNREGKEVKDVSTTKQSPNSNKKFKGGYPIARTKEIAKDCLLTLVKSRLALESPGWLVVRMFVCHHAENG